MFDVLTYTDCAAEDSVSGRSGFQFQAESAGATATDEQRISTGLLHVVPIGLDPERPESHPPTCAYSALDGRYYLTRGRSTGRTLSGRPGNQLTQAIVTSEPADILPLRPAQLFSASSWTLAPAASQEIPGWEAPLEIDPAFETAGLHEMVTTDPWFRQLLPTFLTMVEAATSTAPVKLVILHPEQDVVMRWIALASLFEDGDRALDLSFRVYSADPLGETARVVGAHPVLTSALSPAAGSGYHLVDLVGRVTTPVEVSPSAALHAAWFLGNDPYQALDAVETSRRWATVFDPGTAALAASAGCLDADGTVAGAESFGAALHALGALAEAGQHEELEAYGDALLDVVVGRRPEPADDIGVLTTAMWKLQAAKEDALATGLALAGLEWAVQLPAAASAWCRSHPVPRAASQERRLHWADAEAAAHAADLVAQALAACPDDDLAPWFSLARALATGLPAGRMAREIERLARQWADRPAMTQLAFTWLHVDQVTILLQEELGARFARGDGAAIDALAAGEWDWLARDGFVLEPDIRPLTTWLVSRTLARSPLEQRLATLHTVAPLVPDWASALFLESRPGQVEADELVVWLHSHRAVSPGLARLIQERINVDFRAVRRGALRRLADALRPGVTGLTPSTVRFLADHSEFLSALDEAERRAAAAPNRGLRQLADYPPDWLKLHAAELAEVLLSAVDETAIAGISDVAAGVLDHAVERAVVRMADEADVRALTGTLRLQELSPQKLGRAARRGLLAVWEDPEREPVWTRMVRALPPAWDPLLQDFEASASRGRRTRAVARGARRILDTKDRD